MSPQEGDASGNRRRRFHELLAPIDFSASSSSKYNELTPWLAQALGVAPADVRAKWLGYGARVGHVLNEFGRTNARLGLLIVASEDLARMMSAEASKFIEERSPGCSFGIATQVGGIWSVRTIVAPPGSPLVARWLDLFPDAEVKSVRLASATPAPRRTPRDDAAVDLAAVLADFSAALHESRLSFGARHDDFVRTFLASLAAKPFLILTGLSGSGKTQIALRFGEWLGEGRCLVLPVRPDWTGSEALFGYEDVLQPIVDGARAWHVPEALAFMLSAARDPAAPYLLILDEMNLAHVERYFADFLSGMETGKPCLPNLEARADGAFRPAAGAPSRLPVPANLFVVGTVNVDETTYLFSPKVLDRANTIELRVRSEDLGAAYRRPTPCRAGPAALVRGFLGLATDEEWQVNHPAPAAERVSEDLRRIHAILTEGGYEFGHRVFYEALRFTALLASAGDSDPSHALDLQVMQKILPRLHGSRRRLEPTLCALGAACVSTPSDAEHRRTFDPLAEPTGDARLPLSFDKIRRMLRNLRANQFTSFTE